MEALEHFRWGMALYREGQVTEALADWRQVVALGLKNWVVRKQIWSIVNPERLYKGAVD